MGWRCHGLSVAGYSHRRQRLPCQDAWGLGVAGEVTVLAVADGAGSRPRSEEGSKMVVDLAVHHLTRRDAGVPPGPAVHALLRAAFTDIRADFLHRTGAAAPDYASTLTAVVLAPAWLGYLTVGDGFAVLRAGVEDGERQYHLLPRGGAASEYGNETVFVTSDSAERWVRTDCVADDGVDGVLLSTDGLAQAALSRTGPNASFATAVFRSLEAPGADPGQEDLTLGALLRSERLTALNADDKTLVRAVRT